MHRLFTLQRAAHASPVAMATLVAANLVPLAGVLFLGWDLITLVVMYWAENFVVGVFAVGRIMTVDVPDAQAAPTGEPPPPPPPWASRRAAVAIPATMARVIVATFFCFHYGMFWVIHGFFVWFGLPSLFTTEGSPTPTPDLTVVATGVLILLVSHAVSFKLNWLDGGEYRTSNPGREMNAPYTRVVVLHLTIIFGAIAAASLGAPVWALVIMVVLKTGFDLSAHLAERRRAAVRAGEAGIELAQRARAA